MEGEEETMVSVVRCVVRELASFGAVVSFVMMIALWGDVVGRFG
jgi:hypothetical protein